MARRRKHPPLNVFLNGRLVGRLRRESTGAIDFQYDDSWLEWESAIPVSLSLPLREDRYIGAPVSAVFENLLPDSEVFKQRLAERSGAEGKDAYSLLAAVGRDCVGALQFLPEGMEPDAPNKVKGRAVTEADIAKILANLARSPLGIGEDQDFRISLAGAQEKTALLFWRKRWLLPHGTTATTHIIKPQISKLESGIDLSNSVENEYLCLKLVEAFGLPAAHAEITKFAGRRALVIERFDRRRTRDQRLLRLPQEDCCQALGFPPTRKYQADGGPGIRQIIDLLKGSDEAREDQSRFLKAQIVFWVLANTDAHAKNYSLHLAPGGRFRLAPIYDVVSVQPSIDAGEVEPKRAKLAMPVGKNRHNVLHSVLPRHFLQTAKLCGIPQTTAKAIMEELGDTGAAAIDKVIGELPKGFPQKLAKSIADGAKARLGKIADADQ
ncbi:MAG: type II toxin-antitoxin system HipA family toxin [Hyphomonadaceae bacterium]|nr:type II toxin-antitoxin system HipA family toxin [Hyphomonadaceae bacterium]